MLRLAGTHEGRRFLVPIGPASVTVGKDSRRCDIPLDLPGVSRRHARIERTASGVALVDLQSKNGLWSGGVRHDRIELQPGDRVRIGVLWLTLEEVSTSDEELAPLPPAPVAPATQTHLELPESAEASTLPALLGALRTLATPSAPETEVLDELRRVLELESLTLFRRVSGGPWLLAATAGAEGLDLWPGDDPPAGTFATVGTATALLGKGDSCQEVVEEALATALALLERAAPPRPKPRARPPRDPELVLPVGLVTGSSPAARALFEELAAALRSGLDVLLRGESGVGKESLAELIHRSAGAAGRFVPLNCGAIAAGLFESELFGIEAGTATGVQRREGLVQQAAGGTLFLDEVGNLPLDQQAKLLRALQERRIQPVGSRAEGQPVKFRVVSATHRDLAAALADGSFRADLYFRLAGFVVQVPPLRERREDIPALAAHFARKAAQAQKRAFTGISRKALKRLLEHPWPGNIRELEAVLTRAAAQREYDGTLHARHLERALQASEPVAFPPASDLPTPTTPRTLAQQVADCQRTAALEALKAENDNRTRAAARLGLTRNGFAALLKRLGLDD